MQMPIPAYVAFRHNHGLTNVHGLLDMDRTPYTQIDEDAFSEVEEMDFIHMSQSNIPEEIKLKMVETLALKLPEDAVTRIKSLIAPIVNIPSIQPHLLYNKPPKNDNETQEYPGGNRPVPPPLPVLRDHGHPPSDPLMVKRDLELNLNMLATLPDVSWFDPMGISEIEAQELTPHIPNLVPCVNPDLPHLIHFINLRNVLIDVYRSRPNERLTISECRKHCDGDLSTLMKLVSFLEQHRLVNYRIENTSSNAGLDNATIKLRQELSTYVNDSPMCSACDKICLYSFFVLNPTMYGSCLPFSTLRSTIWCGECARDAPHSHCLIKINLPTFHARFGNWNEQQIYAMLDAIELHGTDWRLISEAVNSVPNCGSRTPRECLAMFLSLPIIENSPVANYKIHTRAIDPESERLSIQLLLKCLDTLKNESEYCGPGLSLKLEQLKTVANDKLENLYHVANDGMGAEANGSNLLQQRKSLEQRSNNTFLLHNGAGPSSISNSNANSGMCSGPNSNLIPNNLPNSIPVAPQLSNIQNQMAMQSGNSNPMGQSSGSNQANSVISMSNRMGMPIGLGIQPIPQTAAPSTMQIPGGNSTNSTANIQQSMGGYNMHDRMIPPLPYGAYPGSDVQYYGNQQMFNYSPQMYNQHFGYYNPDAMERMMREQHEK